MSSHPKIIEKIFIDTKKLGRESENPNLIEITDARKKRIIVKNIYENHSTIRRSSFSPLEALKACYTQS